MCYWGYKFEDYATRPLDAPHQPYDANMSTVNTNVQYCSVYKSKIGNVRLLVGAEVDCMDTSMETTNIMQTYIELKTSRKMQRFDEYFYRVKLLKYWAQSFLPGIPRIIVGFRDDQGHVKEVQTIKTLDIPRMVRKYNYWDPNVCLTTLNNFIEWLLNIVQEDDPDVVYRISFDAPFREFQVSKCNSPGFLLQAFIDHVE
jgi:RAT1-interacting protein